MDAEAEYSGLTAEIKENLPLKALPIRELVHIFREKGLPITLKTELTIKDVYNSGDISGIMCAVHSDGDQVLICALTHLIFSPHSALFKEISDY